MGQRSPQAMQRIFAEHSKGCQTIGIGSGRTMELFSSVLSADKVYVPTGLQAEMFLRNRNTHPCANHSSLDLYFDGVDYYNDRGDLIKGRGGAITLERLLYTMASRTVIIAQKSKFRGSFKGLLVPVAILKESYGYFVSRLEEYHVKGYLRKTKDITPFVTDQGNLIVDVEFDSDFLSRCNEIAGVIAHGYFESADNIAIEEIDEELQ